MVRQPANQKGKSTDNTGGDGGNSAGSGGSGGGGDCNGGNKRTPKESSRKRDQREHDAEIAFARSQKRHEVETRRVERQNERDEDLLVEQDDETEREAQLRCLALEQQARNDEILGQMAQLRAMFERRDRLDATSTAGSSGSGLVADPRLQLPPPYVPPPAPGASGLAPAPAAPATATAPVALVVPTAPVAPAAPAAPVAPVAPVAPDPPPAYQANNASSNPNLIPTPSNFTSVSMGAIRQLMGLTDDPRWLQVRASIRDFFCLAGLDLGFPWKKQNKTRRGNLYQLAWERIPELQRFENNWAAELIVQDIFNHRRTYANKRQHRIDGADTETDENGAGSSGSNDHSAPVSVTGPPSPPQVSDDPPRADGNPPAPPVTNADPPVPPRATNANPPSLDPPVPPRASNAGPPLLTPAANAYICKKIIYP
ncbi:hypothetical protein FRC12_020285 [Ceratobasidium sp. 428]|nr:hypothetical protein FRC12_020285 [Ceratobasidium sp. 428]